MSLIWSETISQISHLMYYECDEVLLKSEMHFPPEPSSSPDVYFCFVFFIYFVDIRIKKLALWSRMKNRTPHTSTREALQQSFAWVNCDHCRIHSVWQSSAILNSPAGRPWTRLGPDLPDPWTMEIWTINLVSIKLKATLMKLNDCLRCYSTGKAARAHWPRGG